jgi:hypothetical protein
MACGVGMARTGATTGLAADADFRKARGTLAVEAVSTKNRLSLRKILRRLQWQAILHVVVDIAQGNQRLAGEVDQ